MERRGSAPAGVRPRDVVELMQRPGPFATVWLTTPLEVGHDPLTSGSTNVRRALASGGAPEAVIDHVTAAVAQHRHDGAGLVLVADSGGTALVEALGEPPRGEVARWSAIPSVAPVLENRQAQIPYVVALLDRTGADLFAGSPDGDPDVVAGRRDDPIRKSAPGGWSQRRFQQRAENTWEENAGDVAEHLSRLVQRTRAELVLVGGDVRARQLLSEALPATTRGLLREITGGRAKDGSDEQRIEETERLVRTAVAADTVDLLKAFRQDSGQGRAADGREATIEALREGRVDVLLVHDDPADEDTAWTGTDPEHIALDRSTLVTMGVSEPREARLVDAVIRAALLTSASVRVVPASNGPAGGMGALLRW